MQASYDMWVNEIRKTAGIRAEGEDHRNLAENASAGWFPVISANSKTGRKKKS
jgi:hypothetical protein